MLETTILAAALYVLAASQAPIEVAEVVATPTAPAGEDELPGGAGSLHPPEDRMRVLDDPPRPNANTGDPEMPGALPGGAGSLPGGAGGLPSTGAPGRNAPGSGTGGVK